MSPDIFGLLNTNTYSSTNLFSFLNSQIHKNCCFSIIVPYNNRNQHNLRRPFPVLCFSSLSVGNSETDMPDVPGKTEWPELVGKKGEEAEAVIKTENPRVFTQRVTEGDMVTAEVDEARVRVWVNTDGVVTQTPRIG